MASDMFNPNGLFIIAEAGVNHNGSVTEAKKMVDVAKAAGADAVKFQTWITEQVYSKTESLKPDYQKAGTDPNESEFATVKRNELSFQAFRELKAYCDKVGITMMSTPDEWQSADFLINELRVPAIKVASQDVNNLPFLRYLGSKKIPMILSTGASTMAEASTAVETILEAGCPKLAVLHCTSCYPAPIEATNLSAISTMRDIFKLPIGYSDHTTDVFMACGAVALGAIILEKHFTLSRALPGPDQQASVEPEELRRYIDAVRAVKAGLGNGIKTVQAAEATNRVAMRRYLAIAHDLPAGHVLKEHDIAFMKITFGLEPATVDKILGASLKTAMKAGTRIQLDGLTFSSDSGFAGRRDK